MKPFAANPPSPDISLQRTRTHPRSGPLKFRMGASVLAVLVLNSCFQSGEIKIPDSSGEFVARQVIDLVRSGQVEEALQRFGPSDRQPHSAEILEQTITTLSATSEIKLINYRFFKSFKDGGLEETFAFHATGSEKAALVFVSTRTANSETVFTTFLVQSAPVDLSDVYPFTMTGKGPLQRAAFLAVVVTPIFILFTIVAIARSSRNRKWLWVLFALIGIGKFSIQWVEGGQWVLQPLAFQVLGASVLKNPVYEPWVLSVSLPLGAVLFWITNRVIAVFPPSQEEDTQDETGQS